MYAGTHITHTASRKYEPLTEFLRRQSRAVVRLAFDEIERVIEAKLPPSATHHRAWWSNNAENNVMTKAWRDAGFESENYGFRVMTRDAPLLTYARQGHLQALAC